MHYAYILKSQKDRNKIYVGSTNNLERRLSEHNDTPSCSYIKTFAPWNLKISVSFKDELSALKFEKYLKSHSGRAFIKRHFI